MIKYVRAQKTGLHLFSEDIDHDAFALKALETDDWVVSAGFVGHPAPNTGLICYGKSVTLRLNSDPVNDTQALHELIDAGNNLTDLTHTSIPSTPLTKVS